MSIPRARPSPNPALACSKQVQKKEYIDRSAIRVRENPEPVKVEARVERQQGWACALGFRVQGSGLGLGFRA